MSGLHFRLHWTYEEATQCDKRVILRVRRQSLHRYSIIRRSQRSCGKRRKQRGWTFQPPHRHWSGWEEGSEERVGGVDQGVCKEDVSWRLEGLSFRIQRELNWFFFPTSGFLFLALLFVYMSSLALAYMVPCFSAELRPDMFFYSSVCCRFDVDVLTGQHGLWQGSKCTMDSGLRVLLSTVLCLSQSLLITCSCKLLYSSIYFY